MGKTRKEWLETYKEDGREDVHNGEMSPPHGIFAEILSSDALESNKAYHEGREIGHREEGSKK